MATFKVTTLDGESITLDSRDVVEITGREGGGSIITVKFEDKFDAYEVREAKAGIKNQIRMREFGA